MNQAYDDQYTAHPQFDEEGMTIRELLSIFRKRFFWFLLGLVLVSGAAIGYLFWATPLYESQVSVLVNPIQNSSSIDSLLSVTSSGAKIATEVELITSRSNITDALGRLDLTKYENAEGESYAEVIAFPGSVKEKISVTTVKDTNIVRISVTDADRFFARDFANVLAESYDSMLTSIARNSKTAQRTFIESQIPINDQALREANDKLGDFKERSEIIQLSDKSSLLVNQISYYDLRLEPLRLQLEEAHIGLRSHESFIAAGGTTSERLLERVREDEEIVKKLGELESWLLELAMYESLPTNLGQGALSEGTLTRIFTINNAIDTTKKSLLNRVRKLIECCYIDSLAQNITQILTTGVSIDILQSRAEVFEEELSRLPVLERTLSELMRDVQISEAIGLKLREMLEEIKLLEASVSGNVKVIDTANLPLKPVSPNSLLILAVALLLGSAIGLLLALLVESLDTSIQSEEQVQRIVGRSVPMLGWVPIMKTHQKDMYPMFMVRTHPNSFEAERLKLIANMIYSMNDKRVFSITSSAPAEGKSMIVANTAFALAQLGNKVLVVDGDLRLPSMERFFRLEHRKIGLVDMVTGGVSIEDCIVQPLEDVGTLHLLPAGSVPLVPAAIFSNPRYINGIETLSGIYDYIIIDAPPLDAASELLAIAKRVDGLIVTVRAGVTNRNALGELLESLRNANVQIAGFVFNGVMPTKHSRYGSYGYSVSYKMGKSERRFGRKYRYLPRKRTASWYRKRYKQDVKVRGKLPALFNPVLAFGPHAPYMNLKEMAERNGETGEERIVSTQAFSNDAPDEMKEMPHDRGGESPISAPSAVKEPPASEDAMIDFLSMIEEDEASRGKK
ncbi:MAG: polysaccharide biosynthesis tyrosine autokinase [Spirochaetales bacterium]|nr:polysaccharide biosynthesis tyrosine autokinase [Spirochaetales bacterium]